MEPEIIYPDPTRWYVRTMRFFNILDDNRNILSPVKVNLWSANMAAVSTFLATVLAWLGNHLSGIEQVWIPVGTWLAHAHTSHHYDKKANVMVAREMAALKPQGKE
jgi:hypothetical protein